MMRHTIAFCLAAGIFVGAGQDAFAQFGTVQQPVVGRFGVSTTVSVPDRGRAHLGSVSRAGDSRKSFGPLGLGSSRGLFREHSGTSVGVTIHDFEETDRRLLGKSRRYPTGPRLSSSAENAYRSLLASHASIEDRRRTRSVPSSERYRSRIVPSSRSRTARPERSRTSGYAGKFYDDGRRAEIRGEYSLARNYYRVAAKLGSKTAKLRIDVLEAKQSAMGSRR